MFIFFLFDNGGSYEEIGLWGSYSKFKGLVGSFGFYEFLGCVWVNVSNIFFWMYKYWVYEGGIFLLFIVYYLKFILEFGIDI